MRKTLLGAVLFAATVGAGVPTVSAQPHPIDHPGHGPADHGPRAVRLGGLTPSAGKPGAPITILGNHIPPDASVMVNGKPAVATVAADARSIEFAVPVLPPGMANVTVRLATGEQVVGSVEVLPDHGPPPIVPPRDHGGPPLPPPGGPGGYSPPPGGPMGGGPRHEWHMDRPVVSSFFPPKGQPGTTIHIRGQNFAPDSQVLWGGAPVPGVRVSPEEITFNVPAGAATNLLSLRSGALRHDLPIGGFEVATWDAAAEQRRLDDDARRRAEADWRERQKAIAHDRAARDAALAQQEAQLDSSREARREAWIAQLRAKFQAAFLADPETQSEIGLHAKRAAEIDRMSRLADDLDDAKLGVRIRILASREDQRHDQRMKDLEAAFRAGGGR